MTEKAAQDVFQEMTLTKILVAILETHKEINIPILTFLDAANEDKELQVDYDEDSKVFTFKLRSKDVSGN